MFVGRVAERSRVDALLAEARDGRSRALVIRGEPGIGKSALLAVVAADAEGWAVLAARGVAAESGLPYAGLHQLLSPMLDRLDAVPAVQADALRGALGLAAPQPEQKLGVLAGTLGVLAAAAREQPVLIVLDDAHALDTDSAELLASVARRLHIGGTALIAGVRSDRASSFADEGFEQIQLAGLTLDETRTLLADRVDADDVIEQLWRETGGNPLALTSLAERLGAGERSGREPIVGPLPAATRIRRIYESRIVALPEETRRALLVAAASDGSSMATIGDALAAIGADPARLAAAEQAGIVTIRDGAIEFPDPLLRSAVYHDAPPDDRRAAHDALAGALAEERDSDRRAWHQASAASAPDEAVASALEAAALRARRRGGIAVEAMALARAARLTPDAERRARRLLDAGRSTARAGRLGQAAGQLEEALMLTGSSGLTADLELERSRLLVEAGHERAAAELLERAADRVEQRHPERGITLLVERAQLLLEHDDVAAAGAAAARAAALAAHASVESAGLRRALAAVALARGELGPAELTAAGHDGAEEGDPAFGARLARVLTIAGDRTGARGLLSDLLERHRVTGNLWSLQLELCAQADLELRSGQLLSAIEAARESLQLGDELGGARARRQALLVLAKSEALLGREVDCRNHAAEALELAQEHVAPGAAARSHLAIGLLELSLSHPAEAVASLEAVGRHARHAGIGHPEWLAWEAPLVEGYAGAGELDDARQALAGFERDGARVGGDRIEAAIARCAGLVAADDAYPPAFDRALALAERDGDPFAIARTRLCYGERLVRSEDPARARELLRPALDSFELAGASPWLERTRTALAACGEITRRRAPRAVDLLTPQELQVVRLVAAGGTNRDVAGRLFLSPKTVEYHLRNTFRKLGVRSRTELVARIAEEGGLREHR